MMLSVVGAMSKFVPRLRREPRGAGSVVSIRDGVLRSHVQYMSGPRRLVSTSIGTLGFQ